MDISCLLEDIIELLGCDTQLVSKRNPPHAIIRGPHNRIYYISITELRHELYITIVTWTHTFIIRGLSIQMAAWKREHLAAEEEIAVAFAHHIKTIELTDTESIEQIKEFIKDPNKPPNNSDTITRITHPYPTQ